MYILDQNKIKGQNLDVSKFYIFPNYNNQPIGGQKSNNSTCENTIRCNVNQYKELGLQLGVFTLPTYCYNQTEPCKNKIIESENNFRIKLMENLLWKQADRYRGVSEPKFIF